MNGFHRVLLCVALTLWLGALVGAAHAAIDLSTLGEPRFARVGDSESIPDGNVTALAEDRQGFIWIGTTQGLLRFDGYRFRRFLHDPDDPASLSGNFVRSLLASRDGRLWVGTDGDGVSVFDPVRERFARLRQHDSPGASSGRVRALAQDAEGGVWIGGEAGLDYWRPADNRLQRYTHADKSNGDGERVLSLAVAADGQLWIGTWLGLSRLAPRGLALERVQADHPRLQQPLLSLLALADGRLVISGADASVTLLDPRSGAITHPTEGRDAADVDPVVTLAMLQSAPDELWLGGVGGVNVLDLDNGRLRKQWRAHATTGSGFQLGEVRALLRDRAGMLWMGGYGGGLQRYDPRTAAVRVLSHQPGRPGTLSHPRIASVLETTDGQLWLGTRGNGLDVLDRATGHVAGWRAMPGRAGALGNGVVLSLAEQPDGNLWVGTDIGLFDFQRQSHRFNPVVAHPELATVAVRRLLPARTGELWIGTGAGLSKIRPGRPAVALSSANGEVMRAAVHALVEADDGRLWVGSQAGLFTVASGSEHLQRVVAAEGSDDVGARPVLGLLLDRRGRLWLDTDRGLQRLVHWNGQHARFEAAGPTGQPFGANLLEDDQGRLWSQEFLFDPERQVTYRLGREDGVDFGTPWYRAYTRTRDGLLLFGGSEGLLVVDPEQFQIASYAPPLVVTELRIDGTAQALGGEPGSVVLSPEQQSFSIEFAALDYSAPQKLRYAYQLEGYDRDWIDSAPGHRVASYTNLWPGRYTLRVRGSDRKGEWSPHELRYPVQIMPAYWQTGWFAALVLLALIALAQGGYFLRTARMRARARALQALVSERSRELQASMQREREHEQLLVREKLASASQLTAGLAHEINNPINFAALAAQNQQDLLARLREFLLELAGSDADPEVLQAIKQRIAALLEQTEQILDGTRRVSDIVQDLRAFSRLDPPEPRPTPIGALLAATVRLAGARYRQLIDFEVQLPVDPAIRCLPARLNQAFMNLVINACHAIEQAAQQANDNNVDLRAAYRGRLIVRSEMSDTKLLLRFEDNGCGIPEAIRSRIFEPFFTTKPEDKGTGLGLAVTRGIIEEHGGRIALEATALTTCFVVTLPLAQENRA